MHNRSSMLRISNSLQDKLILFLPILWIGMILFVYLDLGFIGMYLSIIHGMINALLGLVEGEKVNKKLFFVFVIGWGILMFAAITGMTYYYNFFGNEVPTFTILGMHPSSFYFYIVCWMGNLAYLSGFLYFFRDTWLSEEKWNTFVEYAASLHSESKLMDEEKIEIVETTIKVGENNE